MADILKGLLAEHKWGSLDVATAYFTVGGSVWLKGAFKESFRLLLGAEPSHPRRRRLLELYPPGLTSNRELNLAHKVLLDAAEVEDREAGR